MENNKRTIQETINYFKNLAYGFAKDAHRNNDLIAKGKSEAYGIVAFELEKNTDFTK